jgi:hypothetical protein
VVAAVGLCTKDLFMDSKNGHTEIVATYPYVNEKGVLLFEVVRFDPKDFRQRKPDGAGGWEWKLGNARRVLYRLPQVLEAIENGDTIYVAEGEKDVHALERAGVVATCNPGGAGKWRSEYTKAIRGTVVSAKVVIVADRDEAGREHARLVADKLRLAVVSLDIVEPAEGKDISDHLATGRGLDELVPINLETEVCAVEQNGHGDPARIAPKVIEPVDGAELLDALRGFILDYIVLPSDAVADLLAAWVVHTHAISVAYATPYLRITSATRECGKTLLMELLATLVRHGWHAINPSTAVMYRKIDSYQPCLLLDEMDNYPLDERRDALAVLNAGYKRGATVDRCKESGELEAFSAFCPKAYAGIDESRLPDTLLSRSITIRLERRRPSDHVADWIGQDCEPLAAPLRELAARWAQENVSGLDARPELPTGIVNRAAEVWRPLVAIADRAGGEWPDRIRAAARELAVGGDGRDDVDPLVRLLVDIRDAFGGEIAIFTKSLIGDLNGREESPWGACRRGEGLDARGLSRMLRPLKTPAGAPLRPKKVRIGGETLQGYEIDQFADAFARYLQHPEQAEHPEQTSADAERDVPDVPDVPDKSPHAPGHGCAIHRKPAANCRYCASLLNALPAGDPS